MADTNGPIKAPQDVAIVGLSCRFSGDATNADGFWEMLCNGKSGHSETTRFNPKGFSDPGFRKHNQSATAHGHFLQQDVGAFDTGFFGITPEEASAIDPQQRLILEVAYEAFENAGITTQQLAGSKTSCFIASFTSDYREMIFRDPDAAPRYTVTGTAVSMLANRISWFFDLRGPSVALNTACSSSLVALHLARRSLQSGEADIAIVGGTNLMLGPEMFTFFSNLNFLSRDGLSRSFDASGEGYGRGEGVAAIILKRVDDAQRDNDIIRAIVRSTATNQDGKTKAITLPSLDAQVDLIHSAYYEAGLNFHDTTYFEAHGTGTRRGDPVELEAISKTLCLDRAEDSKLIVGSVKSNVGHTEATAGLAGIIKAIYMLEKGLIPATIHYNKPLPEFDLSSSKLTIPVETKPWPATPLRRISINSFGFGGANAHAVLDDAQSYLASRDIQGASLRTKIQPLPNINEGMANGNGKPADLKSLTNELFFVFSGPDQQALERNLKVIAQHLQTKTFSDLGSESEYLRNLAYTLSERRSMFRLKAAIVAVSVDQLASRIRERCIVRIDKHVAVPTKSNLANGNEGKITRHLLTDLPSYAWDHSRTYWAESRASKEFRHRKHPQRSLIGAPQPSYGEDEHIWRGYLRLSDEPWVKDHQVLGAIVYPAAGYIAMAIEAARDIADKGRAISRYTLRDVQFHSAAVIKEDVPLELIIQLRPHRTATRATSASWLEFAISSCHNERNMRENCFGLLSIEYEAADDSPLALEQSQEEDRILKQYERAHGKCGINQNPKALYEELASVGLNYGQAFQQISKVTKSEGCSSCQVELYTPDRIPDGDLRPVIHPATLDCMIQTIFPALVGHRARMQAAMVPTLLEHMSVSAQTPTSTGTCFRGFSTAKYGGAREMVADFAMLDHETSKPVVITTGLRCTAISELPKPTVEASEVGGRSICSRLMWTPAMDILSPAEQSQVIQSATSLHKLRNFIQMLAFSRTKLSVLELGTASQDAVLAMMSSLSHEVLVSGVLKYTFTCSDEHDLRSVRESQLSRHGNKVAYQVLDLKKSYESQGFQDRTFDVVILSDPSSAMLISPAVPALRKLLSPTGKLCLLGALDTVNGRVGLRSTLEPQNLVIDFAERDFGDPYQGYELVVASWKPDENQGARDQDILVLEGDQPCAAALSDALLSLDPANGSYIPIPRRLLRSSFQDMEGKICIATLEMGQSFLAHATPEDFASFKEIICRCSSVVWVSSSDDPIGSIVTGLARTMRNENAALVFRSLQVPSKDMHSPDYLAEIVSRLATSSCTDNEFKLDEGILKVSRILRDPEMDGMVASMAIEGGAQIRTSTLNRVGRAQKLALPRQGMLDDIYFEADEVADGPLLDDEVEIEIKASGINFRDVLVMMGNIPDNLIGHEASGIISRVGRKVTSFREGDRVCTIGHGCHRSAYRTAANLAHKIPDGMSFEEAATVPLVYCTAYTALVAIARAQKGQTILIHAAAGGVGLAAIQIANHLGLEVFATVSSQPKRQLIQDHGVMEDHILNSRDTSFAKGVMRMTSGRGVDIVLNSLAGEQLRLSWHCLAPFGTFVEIGIKDITANSRLDMSPFAKDATFAAFEIINILHQDSKRMANILADVFRLLQNKSVKPVKPLLSKPNSQVGEALRLLQTGKHMGKVALIWDRDQTIPMAMTAPRPVLQEAATYVLVGGFGGLGRSIASMLANRSARHLCILSRSGAQSQEALEIVQKLEDQGVQVRSFACDVSDERSLRNAIEACKAEMPPIRGVIQGAMVLRDVSFEKMSHSQWHDALRAKVDGTWNLHKLMPKDLDFFIILSSFMGIFGSRTQGNYAAAGAYQDSLAHYRRSQGLKAVSLDLGLMRDVSNFSKKEALSGPFRDWQKPFGLREVDVHGLLDHIIASETGAIPTHVPTQVLTGFGTADEAEKAGIEPPYYLDEKRFALLHTSIAEIRQDSAAQGNPAATPTAAKKEDSGDLLKQAGSLVEAADLILESLIVKVAKHLERDEAEIDPEEPLYTYGVDSLVAIEIKNWIMKEFASDVALLDITAEEPVFELAERIAVKSKFVSVAA